MLKFTPGWEHNRGLEFRLLFWLMIHLGQMILPFLSTPCDKRYVGESQFSRLQGCPHTAADIKPHGKRQGLPKVFFSGATNMVTVIQQHKYRSGNESRVSSHPNTSTSQTRVVGQVTE